MSKQGTRSDGAAKLLQTAQQALNRGDVIEMLRALEESRYLDGLTRRLQQKWARTLPSFEVDDCIAQATDLACAAASRGRKIRSLGAWLWKAADKIANDKWSLDYDRREELDDATVPGVLDPEEADREREERQALEESRHTEAIRIARELLPRIGEGQVRDVMELVIDAAEDRLPDLPSSDIAEALGISKNAARALVSRGMTRLRRLAEQEGVATPVDLPETDQEEEEHNA